MQTYQHPEQDSMCIGVVGTDYTLAPLALRERLAEGLRRPSERGEAVDHGAHTPALPAGTVLLSTCHRVEVYFDSSQASADEVVAALARAAQATPDQLAPHLNVLVGRDAVRHAVEVASGLRSMTLGEGQVLTQVRGAFEAQATGSSMLQRLGQIAVRTGKRVRTQTRIGRTYTSLADLAVHRLVESGADFRGRTLLIVGSGRMARLVARKAISLGIARLKFVCRRPDVFQPDAGAEAALRDANVRLDVGSMDGLEDACATADFLFSATASPHPVVSAAVLERAVEGRSRPLYVVDLAVPRDVEPPAREHPMLVLLTVDELSSEEEQASALDLERAHRIVDEAVEEYCRWAASLANIPAIVSMRQEAKRIRDQELQQLLARLGPLTDEQREHLVAFSRRLTNKILHVPTMLLKQSARR